MTHSLKRGMKWLSALFLTLSLVTPASSVFIIAPGVVNQAGTGAFLGFIFAAIICVFTAYVYAELSSAYPLTGGEYTIVGRILGPFYGFIILGVNLMSLIFIFAAISLGTAQYITPIFPHATTVPTGIAVVVISTLFGFLHIKANAFVTGIFLSLEMLVLVIIAWLGFSHIERPFSDFIFNPIHLNDAGVFEPVSMGMIGLAISVAIWAYNGYGSAVYLGEELEDAPKKIGRVILWALIITVLAEAIPITAILLGAPDLKALIESKNMMPEFIMIHGGPMLTNLISLGIALAILNANIATAVVGARQFFSTGRDHVWSPLINHALTRVHKKFHSPWVATLVFGTLATFACLIDINILFVIIGTGLIVVYAALCIALLVARHKKLLKGHYRMPLYPLPPIIGLIALGYCIYANYLDKEVGRPSLLVTLAMILLSAAYYFLVLRRRGSWILRGPEDPEM